MIRYINKENEIIINFKARIEHKETQVKRLINKYNKYKKSFIYLSFKNLNMMLSYSILPFNIKIYKSIKLSDPLILINRKES